MGVWTRTAIIDYLKSAGLDELIATKLSEQFIDASGNVPYTANDVQKRWAGKFGSLSDALGKMAEYYKYNDQGQADAAQMLQSEKSRMTTPQGMPVAPVQAPASGRSSAGVSVTINLNGSRRIVNTDADGANALQDLLRELQSGKSVS